MWSFSIRYVCLTLLAAGIVSAPGAAAQSSVTMTIATAQTSGVYYPFGKGMAEVLTKYLPDTIVTAKTSNGSVPNIEMLVDRSVEFAMTQADVAWDAYKGYNKFSKPMPVRAVAALYSNRLHVVTLENSGIRTVKDLHGKRVAMGLPGSVVDILGRRLLEASGIDVQTEVKPFQLGPGESAAALKEGKVDAFILPSGVPTKPVVDLSNDPDVKIRLIDTAVALPVLLRKHGPVYTQGVIPAKSYKGQVAAVKVTEAWNLLVVRADMDEKLVYDVLKALFSHKDELIKAHVVAAELEMSNQPLGGSPIPFHPGAAKFYAEHGLKVSK